MMIKKNLIYLASNNPDKAKEIKKITKPFGLELKCLSSIHRPITWQETGATFLENALIKATAVQKVLFEAVIADDSGLCVEALSGQPGVKSSRFSHETASDEENMAKLLKLLHGVPMEKRKAYFICHITFLDWQQRAHHFEGKIKGRITEELRGQQGFGYDPIFKPDGHELTFAQLDGETKNHMSHRFQALSLFQKHMARLP
jgi:non-canonical purine NTP pyrophosphatase (RdgB/HAM1 family)